MTSTAVPTPTQEDANNNMTDMDMQSFMAFYNDTVEFEALIGLIIPSIFAVVVLIGVVGNLLVVVVALNRQMRNSTNTLIIGLAVSDLMFLLICIPFTAVDYAMPVYIFPGWTCALINYCQHISAYFSVWTLTMMAADRFLAVCYPVGSMTLRNTRNTFILLVIVYSIIAASQIPVGLMHGIYTYDFILEQRSACAIVSIALSQATALQARLYFMSFNFFGYILPLGITTILYYFMLKRLWRSPRPGSSNTVSNSIRHRPETVRAKRKVTRLVLCVVIIWAVCWLPLNVCFFFSGLSYPETLVIKGGKIMVIVQIASQVLAYMNSCLNPILYALMSENFRKGFVRILGVIGNRATRGFFCRSEARSTAVSRMEVTHYVGHTSASSSIRAAAARSIRRVRHGASSPSCAPSPAGPIRCRSANAFHAATAKGTTLSSATLLDVSKTCEFLSPSSSPLEHCSFLLETSRPRGISDATLVRRSRLDVEMRPRNGAKSASTRSANFPSSIANGAEYQKVPRSCLRASLSEEDGIAITQLGLEADI